jgi:hypothetical protein
MKNLTKILGIIVLAAVIGFSFTACDDKPEERTVPNPVTITKDNGLIFYDQETNEILDAYVTIRSDDKYTDAEWDAIVKKVITALKTTYESPSTAPAVKNRFKTVFSINHDAQIVLVKNLAHNWEVIAGEARILHLKTGSIATTNYITAINFMETGSAYVGNATPAKDRAFLANSAHLRRVS